MAADRDGAEGRDVCPALSWAELAELKEAIRKLRREYKDERERRQAENQLMILPPRKRVRLS